ncbi:MAG: hypothetical protein JSU85_09760 [Candidatus Zixiibacteriota bacterium]|nr:MAG: hypothetical protein JSU85_09760 [candidate division Zixibacteria bacterium]
MVKGIGGRYSLKPFILALSSYCIYLFFPPAVHAGKVYISKGTEIPAKYRLTLSTELKNKPAESEIFEIASDQKISGIGVIRQGDAVYCEIIEFKKPGLLGSGGAIEVRIDSIQTALGKNIKVESITLKAKGKSKRLKAFLMLPVLGYGILVKGDQAELGRQNDIISLKTLELEAISF